MSLSIIYMYSFVDSVQMCFYSLSSKDLLQSVLHLQMYKNQRWKQRWNWRTMFPEKNRPGRKKITRIESIERKGCHNLKKVSNLIRIVGFNWFFQYMKYKLYLEVDHDLSLLYQITKVRQHISFLHVSILASIGQKELPYVYIILKCAHIRKNKHI